MAFKLYEGTRAVSSAEEISISSTGVIVVSAALTNKHLKDVEFVQLYFDSEGKRIGIKPLEKEMSHSYKLVRPGKRAAFSGRGFFKSNHLFVNDKGTIIAQKQIPAKFEAGMIVFKSS